MSSFLLWSKHTVLKYSFPLMLRRKHLMSKAASVSSKISPRETLFFLLPSPEHEEVFGRFSRGLGTFYRERGGPFFRGLRLSYKGRPATPSQGKQHTLMDDMRGWLLCCSSMVHSCIPGIFVCVLFFLNSPKIGHFFVRFARAMGHRSLHACVSGWTG